MRCAGSSRHGGQQDSGDSLPGQQPSAQPPNRLVRLWQAIIRLRNRVFGAFAGFFAAGKWAWLSWPGKLLRWGTILTFATTFVANVILVPIFNAFAVHRVERQASDLLQRPVAAQGISWVSPPGIVGMGPLAAVESITVGQRGAVERSEGFVGSAKVRLKPGASLLQRRLLFDLEVSDADVTLRQAENYSWFGFPDDTQPSARDFVPGARGGGAGGGAVDKQWRDSAERTDWQPGHSHWQQAADARPDAASPSDCWPFIRHDGCQLAQPVHCEPCSAEQHSNEAPAAAAGTATHSQHSADGASSNQVAWLPPLPLASMSHSPQAAQHPANERSSPGHGARGAAPASVNPVAEVAEQPGSSEQRHSRPPAVALRRVKLCDSRINVYVFGAQAPRILDSVAGDIELGKDYHALDLSITADAQERPAHSFACSMPMRPEARNLRDSTEGATATAPFNDYPIIQQGPSPQSRAKASVKQPPPAHATAAATQSHTSNVRSAAAQSVHDAQTGRPMAGHPHAAEAIAAKMASSGQVSAPGAQPQQDSAHASAPSRSDAQQQAERLHQLHSASSAAPDGAEHSVADTALAGAESAPQPQAAADAPHAPATQLSGGRVAVSVKASNMLQPGVWPECDVTISGVGLHAPIIERLIELPMDIYGGTLNGTFGIHMHSEREWRKFPAFSGRIEVSNAAFHFWDSPDDFSATDMVMHFDGGTMHLLRGTGAYGAVHMAAHGDMGMNPSEGRYNLQVRCVSTCSRAAAECTACSSSLHVSKQCWC